LLGGEYPQYQAFVPAEFSAIAEIPAAPFAEAVKRVALVAERDTPVRPTFSGGRVRPAR
jgi:DNA polymerase III subunit beta